MTYEQYCKKIDELEAKLDAIRARYNKPTEWMKDPEYRKLSAEKQAVREAGYDE